MVDQEIRQVAGGILACLEAILPLSAKPTTTLDALFRRSDRWAPASHQAIPKITAKMVAKANATRMPEAIISRLSMLRHAGGHRGNLPPANRGPLGSGVALIATKKGFSCTKKHGRKAAALLAAHGVEADFAATRGALLF
ncbi:hypothetical protein NKI51_10785 [Mesorhizobium australicum]|uniref:hypothetical protein n=1 Tax=Mesorhizobium australicum TaxID=536018 RepID=UPI00333509CD